MSAELAMAIPIMAWGAIKGLFSDTVLGDDTGSHASRNSITIQKKRFELALDQREVLLEAFEDLSNASDELKQTQLNLLDSKTSTLSIQVAMQKFLESAKQNPDYIKKLVESPGIHSMDLSSEHYQLEECFDFVMGLAVDSALENKEEKTI